MQYTRPMIDLVYEIRRRVDAEMKPSVKMANPEMLRELADYHHHTKDTVTKTLIKELLFLAGAEWTALLEPDGDRAATGHPKQLVKVYRGQTILVDAHQVNANSNNATANTAQRGEILANNIPTPAKPVRMYRGHPIIS
ncbi:MAG TPA: hypothetical protein VLC79_17285 [Cellvibrio sp.]|nr:hypothetical protein [Cellvibrio sp.]